MATTSVSNNLASSYSGKAICRIVGIACLAGFIVDMLILALPPALGNPEWRIGFLQQVGDRAVILLFGLALVMYSVIDFRRWRKRLATVCLVLGVLFTLSCILVIRDGLSVQQETLTRISTQAAQVQSQIQKAQEDPKTAPNITPERLQQASQLLNNQATALKQSTKTNVLKTSMSSVGNLVVVGFALFGLGQYGSRPSKN